MTQHEQWHFQYTTPEVPEGRVEEITVEDAEKYLLAKLEAEREDPRRALWELASLYKRTGQIEQAFARLQQLSAHIQDPEAAAQLMLSLGQTAEITGDYWAAAQLYEHGLGCGATNPFSRYYLHNNAGYSYNQLGQYEESERHCRQAIEVNSDRHNAYKNAGIALAGLGRAREAAAMLVRAVQANASDPRAVGTAAAARERIEEEMQRKIEEGKTH